jgi:hypothetical protein
MMPVHRHYRRFQSVPITSLEVVHSDNHHLNIARQVAKISSPTLMYMYLRITTFEVGRACREIKEQLLQSEYPEPHGSKPDAADDKPRYVI